MTEDLFDMSLSDLNDSAKHYYNEIKNDEVNFLSVSDVEDVIGKDKLEILKYVIKYKQDEQQALENARVNKAKKARILELIYAKQDEAMSNKSIEELKAELEDL